MSSSPSPIALRAFSVAFILLLLCLAAYIRLEGTEIYHYSPDELNHIELAQEATAGDVLHASLFETHPPLGHLLRHYWMQLSKTPFFIRGFSMAFGLALIPLYYLIGAQLAGRKAGMASAMLATFSTACIIQSYAIRNYGVLLFFLTFSAYAYLRWRDQRKSLWLLAYGLSACLADLTHFSGIFTVFLIAAVESFLLLRQKPLPKRVLAQWVIVNCGIAALTFGVMSLWQPLLALSKTQMMAATHMAQSPQNLLYPLLVVDYLFFYRTSAPYAIGFFTLVMLGIFFTARRVPSARLYCGLAGLAVLMGWVLTLTGAYPASGDRHSAWILPLLLPPAGVALALLFQRLPETLFALLLCAVGMAGYSPSVRFEDLSEYMITEKDWGDYTRFLSALDSGSLIIASRSDAFLVAYPDEQDFYRFYALAHMDPSYAALADYHKTKLLFRPFAYNYTPQDLIDIIVDAEAAGRLKGINMLVFTSTRWSRGTTLPLMFCALLDKAVVSVPPIADMHSMTKETADRIPALALLISKQDFLRELANPQGKAHACLAPKAN